MHFFSVSKYENVNTIIKNSNALSKFYGEHCLSIIVPEKEIKLFKSKFSSNEYKYIELINEDEYISIGKFREIFEEEKSLLTPFNSKKIRIGWYYQQALKLCFFLEAGKKENVVLIDADTFLLNKIEFFEKDSSIIYFNTYEKVIPHKVNCEEILQINFKRRWFSHTNQIASMTKSENLYLNKKLMEYLPLSDKETIPIWVTKIVLRSVIKLNQSLEGAFFSEQELVSFSNICAGARIHKQISFLRWGVKSYLTKKQEKFAAMLGFSHVTYEHWNLKKSKAEYCSFLDFLILIFRAGFVYIFKPKYHFSYLIWLKCRKIINKYFHK